ncbi:acetyltransferase [Thozetella sp. PMI_491]|nr:acetyltransferase [Thozetella sp. PMI_491]
MSEPLPVAAQGTATKGDVQVAVVDSAEDFNALFACAAAAFGHQIHDRIWTGMNPGWDTPEGLARGASRMEGRWRKTTRNSQGDPNVVFLKATVPDPEDASRRCVAGIAIWAQMSAVEGHGKAPDSDAALLQLIRGLHPDDEPEQRFLYQGMQSLLRRRKEVIQEKATADLPATLHLDLCAVDPAFQRRGIALKLVQWGLDEAKRRGGLEATTEASSMGRHVYTRLGFHPEGDGTDIVYEVDSEFADLPLPPNLFLRTGPSS